MKDCNLIGASSAADTDNDAYFFQTGTASVILEGCNVTGFVGIDVSTVTIRDTTKEYVGSIVTDNDIDPSQWCIIRSACGMERLPVHPEQGCQR